MPLHFRDVHCEKEGVSVDLNLTIEDGTLTGLTGPNGAGKSAILRLAAGSVHPDSGHVEAPGRALLAADSFGCPDARLIRQSIDAALKAEPGLLLIGPCFALTDHVYQSDTLRCLHDLRRSGTIILLISHDLTLLERHCDEVLVVEKGRIVGRGDPRQVLADYRQRFIETREGFAAALRPVSRHGDERARITAVEILREDGAPANVVASGETVTVHVRLEFLASVEDPVIGVLIRSRIGVNVYGTNTELEGIGIGPCVSGDQLELRFSFPCHLCAEQYTLTVASHDPDGTAHDWLEEAISFTVADTRYTAGVANLRARVDVRRAPKSSNEFVPLARTN